MLAKNKSTAKPRSKTISRSQLPTKAAPGGEQDVRRRLGNFTTAGEHARVGGRTSGIVGQTTKRGRTDQKKP